MLVKSYVENGYRTQYVVLPNGRIIGSSKPVASKKSECSSALTKDEVYENFKQIMRMCNGKDVR